MMTSAGLASKRGTMLAIYTFQQINLKQRKFEIDFSLDTSMTWPDLNEKNM